METPTELIKTIASKTSNLGCIRDRFSDLPEPIILHVFSFIGSNDIVRLSYVSRQFRKLTLCNPNLFFKLEFDSKKCTSNCKELQRFLKGLLNQHNAPQIHRFRLHWFCQSIRYDAKGSIFSLWVQKALRSKVRELDIGVPVTDGKTFYLPAGVESLKVLKLELEGGKPKLFAKVFTSLETLSLSSVSVPGLEFSDWMNHSCRSLKVLNLEDVEGIQDLDISIPSLKVLTVVDCGPVFQCSIKCSSLETLEISECYFYNLHLNVNAPCLKDLQISNCEVSGNFDIRISAEQLQTLSLTLELTFDFQDKETFLSRCRIYSDNLLSLRRASINLLAPGSTFGIADHTCEEFNSNGLVECIYSVRYAKFLQLNFQIIQALSSQVQLKNITFEHLEHLEHLEASVVDLSDLNENITDIADFLGCCSSLKTLIFICDKNANELSETEVINRLCMEMEKLGALCETIRIAYNGQV